MCILCKSLMGEARLCYYEKNTYKREGSTVMSGQIIYPEQSDIINRMKEEVNAALGEGAWEDIRQAGPVPEADMCEDALSGATRAMFKQFDSRADLKARKTAFCNVRHALTPQHLHGVRESFLQYGNIDAFCEALRQENRAGFQKALEKGERFHGQPVDQSVIDFFEDHPYLLYGARKGHQIHATAIPCQTSAYLRDTDPMKKRYLACHCAFARKSLLAAEGPVSKTLCYCSLGHTMIFWETALSAKLTGEVVESVLDGGLLCRFVINLPDDIMEKYT